MDSTCLEWQQLLTPSVFLREGWYFTFVSRIFFEQKWSDWWFGTFFIFPYIGNNHPNWLIFFRGVGIPPTRLLRTKMVKNIIPRVRESHSVPGRPVSWNSFYGDVGSLSKLHQKSFFSGQSLCYIVEKTRFLPQSILYQIATVYILYSSIFRAFQLYLIDVFCRYQDKWWRQQPHREATRNDGQELGHHSGRTSQVAELWQFIQMYINGNFRILKRSTIPYFWPYFVRIFPEI